jgi:hypothetical protein
MWEACEHSKYKRAMLQLKLGLPAYADGKIPTMKQIDFVHI